MARIRSMEDPGIPIGQGYEVFDAKLLGVVQELRVAWKAGDQRPVTILLDFQPTIARLQHTQSGPGQAVSKQAAGKPPGRGSKEIYLAFAYRARTETVKGTEAEMAHQGSRPTIPTGPTNVQATEELVA